MLGVYVSNAESFRVGLEGLLVPLSVTFVSWGHLFGAFTSLDHSFSYGLLAHSVVLSLFPISILLLAILVSDSD